MSDILFMGSIMMLPRERRPWGIVTWLSEVFQISRPSLYNLTERLVSRLITASAKALPDADAAVDTLLKVTEERLKRTVLTAAFPGKIALRPLQQVLTEAFDETRSIGWISELLAEASEKAGQVLKEVDYAGIGGCLTNAPYEATPLVETEIGTVFLRHFDSLTSDVYSFKMGRF
jgi:hypothetical protein